MEPQAAPRHPKGAPKAPLMKSDQKVHSGADDKSTSTTSTVKVWGREIWTAPTAKPGPKVNLADTKEWAKSRNYTHTFFFGTDVVRANFRVEGKFSFMGKIDVTKTPGDKGNVDVKTTYSNKHTTLPPQTIYPTRRTVQ